MHIEELRAFGLRIVKSAQAINARSIDEDRELTQEELWTFEALMTEAASIRAQIEMTSAAAERLARLREAEMMERQAAAAEQAREKEAERQWLREREDDLAVRMREAATAEARAKQARRQTRSTNDERRRQAHEQSIATVEGYIAAGACRDTVAASGPPKPQHEAPARKKKKDKKRRRVSPLAHRRRAAATERHALHDASWRGEDNDLRIALPDDVIEACLLRDGAQIGRAHEAPRFSPQRAERILRALFAVC